MAALCLPESGLGDQAFIEALNENRIPAGIQVTLSVGDRGPAVSQLQTALSALGYWTQPVDVAVLTGSKVFGLRTYASTGANTICYIKNGEYARVIEKDGGWTYVEYGGEKGYLKNYYLTFETRMEYTETYVFE